MVVQSVIFAERVPISRLENDACFCDDVGKVAQCKELCDSSGIRNVAKNHPLTTNWPVHLTLSFCGGVFERLVRGI